MMHGEPENPHLSLRLPSLKLTAKRHPGKSYHQKWLDFSAGFFKHHHFAKGLLTFLKEKLLHLHVAVFSQQLSPEKITYATNLMKSPHALSGLPCRLLVEVLFAMDWHRSCGRCSEFPS